MQTLLRAILCNWLICLGTWMATASSSLPGKVLAIFLPVMAFVAMGLEHGAANQFAVPLGMMLGSGVSVGAPMQHG
jgi:formate transporter